MSLGASWTASLGHPLVVITADSRHTILELYRVLHDVGVLHNAPGPEHWQRAKNGEFTLVSFAQALFRDNLPAEIWEEAVDAEEHMVLTMLGLTDECCHWNM